ncbi:exodeoxyribonuclease VII small subunit [Flavobacteriales bacterium]|jgi:exodeoxyribonuclease VII small subunit|nr:exodeoxyribonuclease VII small subunit [Flavobacteriales bacterium]
MAKKEIKYSDALEELSEIVDKIDNEEVDVDELSENVKKALTLIKLCKTKLQKTEEEVQQVLKELDEI